MVDDVVSLRIGDTPPILGFPQLVQIIGRWMAWVAISDMGRCAMIALMAADALHWLMDQKRG